MMCTPSDVILINAEKNPKSYSIYYYYYIETFKATNNTNSISQLIVDVFFFIYSAKQQTHNSLILPRLDIV